MDRRNLLRAGAASLAALGTRALAGAQEPAAAPPPTSSPAIINSKPGDKVFRIGVISSRIRGKPQRINGHTWHFAQYFHPEINMPAAQKYLDPGNARHMPEIYRNPRLNFGQLPFPDTRITHYYEQDPEIAKIFCETFPGCQVATSLEKMAEEVDAFWLGDASGFGEDHFDLIAPGLAKGLPTFCDKPIGASVAGTRKILEFAKANKAPIMSSSLFRHEQGTEEACRLRDTKEHGDIQYVIASMAGGYTPDGWVIYGQHPAWTLMTILGPGVDAVSLYAREYTAHGLVTYKDRMPGEIWYGRPDIGGDYCETSVHFQKKVFRYTPAIADSFLVGHHYEMFNMARTFREMIRTRVEPIPHQEILEVTAIIHAGVKSLAEKSRLVNLAEVMG